MLEDEAGRLTTFAHPRGVAQEKTRAATVRQALAVVPLVGVQDALQLQTAQPPLVQCVVQMVRVRERRRPHARQALGLHHWVWVWAALCPCFFRPSRVSFLSVVLLACGGLCRAQWALSVAWVCLGVLESSLGA